MKSRVVFFFKSVYLFTICITLPLALWGLVKDGNLSGSLREGLAFATYFYAPFWLVFFLGLGAEKFPKTITGIVAFVLPPFLQYGIAFFNGSTVSDMLFGAAQYFRATTFSLSLFGIILVFRSFRKNIKETDKKAVKIAVGVLAVLCTLYAVLLNFDSIKNKVTFGIWQLPSTEFVLFGVTSFLVLHGLVMVQNGSDQEKILSLSTQKQKNSSPNHAMTLLVLLVLLSAFASFCVIWFMK